MTQFFYLDGQDIGATIRLGAQPGFTTVADGAEASAGGVQVEDPTGSLNLVGHKLFYTTETACPHPRLFTGWTLDRTISRGPFRTGAGRLWDLNIGDLNLLFKFRIIQGANAKRPAETEAARMAWLLTTDSLSTLIYDNGGVNLTTNMNTLDETDYRGQYASDVLRDCGSILFGKQYFAYWDDTAPAGHEVSLFYDTPSSTFRTSTLRISNVLSDRDGVITFEPFIDGSLNRDPEETYSGIYETYINGIIWTGLSSTASNYIRREVAVDQPRVGRLATATSYAAQFLSAHATEADVITCSVRLPKELVNLIDSGMRISCKFSHLPGYETFTWLRVIRRTVSQTFENPDYYDLALELSMRSPQGNTAGGGNPGVFPLPPADCSTSGTVVQTSTSAGVNTVTLPAAPTFGNTLVRYCAVRVTPSGPPEPNDTDWVLAPPGVFVGGWQNPPAVGPGDGAKVWYRAVKTTDTAVIDVATVGTRSTDVIVEVSGSLTLISSAKNTGTGSLVTCASVTPTAGAVALILGFVCAEENTATGAHFTPSAGWTEFFDGSDAGGHPNSTGIYKRVTSATGSYAPATTFDYSGTPGWATETLAFICSSTSNPPAPGQWVYNETPTPAPGGGNRLFYTLFPYANLSLLVYVDHIDQTAATTETDPTTGAFTLAFDPRSYETILVTYQGR